MDMLKFDTVGMNNLLDEIEIMNNILLKRFDRFTTWLETNDFDKLMFRVIFEHNDKYNDMCYSKGCEPYPNNKLDFILQYVEKYGKVVKVKKLKCDFDNIIYEFKGYYFRFVYGQGVIITIYNKDDLKPLLSL